MSANNSNHRNEFALELMNLLEELEWPQNKLALKLNVSRQFIGTLCKGKQLPNRQMFERLIEIFSKSNVPEDTLKNFCRLYIEACLPEINIDIWK